MSLLYYIIIISSEMKSSALFRPNCPTAGQAGTPSFFGKKKKACGLVDFFVLLGARTRPPLGRPGLSRAGLNAISAQAG